MKKALATIMGLAFAVSAMAQYLIYDYNVSFKRVDAQYTKISYSFDEYDGKRKDYTGYFDSFTTASDKISGYVVIPACYECNGAWAEFGSAVYAVDIPEDYATTFAVANSFMVTEGTEDAYIYLTRNGDRLGKDLTKYGKMIVPADIAEAKGISQEVGLFRGKKILWKLHAAIDAAMFGKGAGVRVLRRESEDCPLLINDTLAGFPTSLKALKQAWLVLTYDVPMLYGEDGLPVKVYPPVNVSFNPLCIEPVYYGFLGYQSLEGAVSNAGFGTVTVATTKGGVSFCGGTAGSSCVAINSISGSTVGYFNYDGFCEKAPLFDICSLDGLNNAPIAGTFTFKLNSNLSKKFGGSYETADDYIIGTKYKGYYLFDVTQLYIAE